MPFINLFNDAVSQSLPPAIRKRRQAAIILSYLTWPNNVVARNGFILEPLAPPISPASGSDSQVDLIGAQLNLAADKIQCAIERKRINVDLRRQLEEASAALQSARDLVASLHPPMSDWEVAAEAANYFSGIDPIRQLHSLLRRHGRKSLLDELDKRCADWHLAGLQLLLIAQMHIHHASETGGEASRRKARNIIEDRTKFNRQQIDEAWSAFKSVSAIAAGVIQTLRRRPQFQSVTTVPSRDYLRATIDGMTDDVALNAAAFQTFALSFRPRRIKTPLLTENTIWMLPVVNRTALDGFLVPLHPMDLQALMRTSRVRR